MKLILACDQNGGIGYENSLPWPKLNGDLARFKQLTMGQTVVMGRNTWDSLPKKPLPNRTNVVISSTLESEPGFEVFSEIPDDLNILDDVWIIGGAKLVNSLWDQIDEIHLSLTTDEYLVDCSISLDYIYSNFDKLRDEPNEDHNYQIWKRRCINT